MTRRILVDLLGFTGTRGGTETYARQIVTRLPERMPDTAFLALANRAGADAVARFFPGRVATLGWVGAGRAGWAAGEVLGVDRFARRARADLIWNPANFGPVRAGVPRVTTTHDLIALAPGGGLAARASAAATSWLLGRTARTADAVITGSHAAEAAIVAGLGVDPARITVIPHGTTAPPALPADPWSALTSLGIRPGRPLVLSSGNRLPHKNFEGLLAAMATIPRDRRPLTVLTGGSARDPLAAAVARLGLGDDVVLTGWITVEQLESLFAVADLYACPSRAEGFGLPVVDAMRRGCPVLANDIPVLREVGGDAADFADADSPVEFGRAVQAALDAPVDARRERGRERAAGYTWERAADGTAAVFEHVLDTTGRRR